MNSSPASISAAATDEPALPDLAAIERAAARLRGQAVLTPLLPVPSLMGADGSRVFVKPEVLQRTGSFKFRGAYNCLAALTPPERTLGVVAFSSGNHAQGVAAAAQLFGVPAVIVMPSDAPAIKIADTRAYGAEVLLYDRLKEDREAIASELSRTRGMTLVPPFDHPEIIAGQGTIGLEIAQQAEAAGQRLDAVLVCCGGGGLVSGTALALKSLQPEISVYGVEPEGFDDTRRSLAAGQRLGNEPGAQSFCDALLSPMPGRLTFALNQRLLAGVLTVSDAEVARAMAFAFGKLKLVVEPGGAVALAALLARKVDLAGKAVAVVLSGGNVDEATYVTALRRTGG